MVKKSSDSFIWRDYKICGGRETEGMKRDDDSHYFDTASFSCFEAVPMMREDVGGVLSPRPSPSYPPRLSSNIPSARKSSLPSLLDLS